MSITFKAFLPVLPQGEEKVRGVRLVPLVAPMVLGCVIAGAPMSASGQESQEEVTDWSAVLESPEAQSGAPAAEGEAEPQSAELAPTVVLEPEPPEGAQDQAPSSAQIEEIVVTATKRAENVREIPASITAITGVDLEQRAAQDAADIAKLVPGVNVTSTGDTPQRVTIRGISSDIGTSSTTGILFGNVSFAETYVPFVSLDPNPFDMASVEVLKGPQGTLFGAGALNGAVRYVPTLPRFGEYEVKWFGQYTSLHKGDAQPTYGAAVNVPLYEDALALRVMAFDRTAPGYIDNTRLGKDTNETDQQGARALLGWRPGDAWDVLLTTAFQKTKLEDVSLADNDEGRLESGDRSRISPNKTRYWFADLSVTFDAEWAQLVSDTSFIDKRGRNFFDASSRTTGSGDLPLLAQQYAGDSETMGQEFRLVSIDEPENRWKWVAGLFAWQQDIKNTLSVPLAVDVTPLTTILDALSLTPLESLFAANGSPLVLQTAADVRVRELAAFGELTRRLGDSVEVSIGGRLYRTESGGENVQSGVYILAQQGSSPFVAEGEVKESGFSPKASALWHVTDDVLVYGLVSKGFRVGGIQPGLASESVPEKFKSDTLWNYEAGIRTQFLDNTLRMDLTGFWVDWKDPQTVQQDPSGLAVYIDNAGGVRSRGGDLSFQYLFPWEGLMLSASASYADTVTTEDFTTAAGAEFGPGTRWPLAPKWQTSTNLAYTRAVGDWIVAGFATYSTVSSAVPTFNAHEVFGYEQLDLQLNVTNARFDWLPQVAVVFNNVTDERGLTNAFTSGLPSPDLAAEEFYYILPRSITLRLMGRFGG